MNDNTQQEGTSDYDTEWGLSDDDSQTSSVDDGNNQQSSEPSDLDGNEAHDGSGSDSSHGNSENSEESNLDDVWANATEGQREAYRRAENEKVAAEHRAKINSDKLAERGRELKALREQSQEWADAARPKTEFEEQHSVYANDINTMIDQRMQERLPVQEELTQAEVDHQTYVAITDAHPTAGDMYNSEAMKTLLQDDPVFKHDGRAVLFSESLHSNNPADVVAALDYYKHTHSGTPSQKDDGLSDMQGGSSRGSQRDMRHSTQKSQSEQYDSEWEQDDD